MVETYYDRLGVDPTASQSEIKSAWRQCTKKYHPDQSDHPNAEQKFKKIKEAYEVLSDKSERARYDEVGHKAYVQMESGAVSESASQGAGQGRAGSHGRQQGSRQGGWTSPGDRGPASTARKHTRYNDAAEHLWDESRTATPAESAYVGDVGKAKAALGYLPALLLPILAFLGCIFGVLSLSIGERGTAVAIVIGGFLFMAVVTIGAITLSEVILDTERRFVEYLQRGGRNAVRR